MVSHTEDISKDYRKMIQFEHLFSILKIWFKEKMPSKDFVLDIFGKLLINSITLIDENGTNGVIGKALFLGTIHK